MRLGGPIFKKTNSPETWAKAVVAAGYKAAYCPIATDADNPTIQAYRQAAQQADITIAEVGAWNNPLSRNKAAAEEALETCKDSLELADKIGARCCVNISGSRGDTWDGPDPANLTDETFDMVVSTVRDIIDSVKPSRTFYTLELMPWMFPNSADSYCRLIQAIDREEFAVHFDFRSHSGLVGKFKGGK